MTAIPLLGFGLVIAVGLICAWCQRCRHTDLHWDWNRGTCRQCGMTATNLQRRFRVRTVAVVESVTLFGPTLHAAYLAKKDSENRD